MMGPIGVARQSLLPPPPGRCSAVSVTVLCDYRRVTGQ